MKIVLLLTFVLGIQAGDYGKQRRNRKPTPPERLSFNHVPVKTLSKAELPKEFDWGSISIGPNGQTTSLLLPCW
jgi:hypothetical protein